MNHPENDGTLALLQARVLSRLFCTDVHDLVVKGGMAMRVAHNHSRQTKDIDLDADPRMQLRHLQRLVRRSIQEATAGGEIEDLVITEPKQTETTARWKINGVVADTGLPLHMTLEISFRSSINKQDVALTSYQAEGMNAPSMIPVYKDERLVINKINALLSPSRSAPRDVVDLFLLFEAGVDISAEAIQGIKSESASEAIKEIWLKLDAMDEEQFKREVLPVWNFPEGKPEWGDWQGMRLAVGERIEALLADTDDDASKNTQRKKPSL